MKRHRTHEEKVAAMTAVANQTRDSADEMARLYGGCDDPLHPWTLSTSKPYSNWIEFAEMVCLPITMADDEAAVQEAMRWYRMECPHFIAACLVFALNRARAAGTVQP